MEHHWFVRNEKEERTTRAASQSILSKHNRGGEISAGGVAFLVNKNIRDRVVEFRGDSSRVASRISKIKTKYYLHVFHVYEPTSTHEEEEVEEFYEEVSKIMSENKTYYKIVIGD